MSEPASYAEQHDRLLTGLADSIREKGLAGVQLGDIVRHARASRRTFYNHFPDKDACFVELARRMSEQVRAQVSGAIDPGADWTTQVDQALDTYLGILAAEPAITLTFASPSLGSSIVRAQRDGIEEYAQFVADMSRTDAFRSAGVPELSLERAYLLVSGIHGTVVRAVERGEDVLALAAEFKSVLKTVLAGSVAVAG